MPRQLPQQSTTATLEVNNPIFDFELKNLKINFIGASVSNSSEKYHITVRDTAYILNKNTKSVHFDDFKLKNAVLRNKHLTSNDKNLITTISDTSRAGDYIKVVYTILFKNEPIGELEIKYHYSYYIKRNTLLLPFQSFPVHAIYKVLDPGKIIKHYYGRSITESDRKTGVMDMNFIVEAHTRTGEAITEDVTFSVNLINGGFERPIDDLPLCGDAGGFAGYECNGCYKRAKYHDGNCGFTYGPEVLDEAYCGCEQPQPFFYVKRLNTTTNSSHDYSYCGAGGPQPRQNTHVVSTTRYNLYLDATCCIPVSPTFSGKLTFQKEETVEYPGTGSSTTTALEEIQVNGRFVDVVTYRDDRNYECNDDLNRKTTERDLVDMPHYDITTQTC